MTPTDQTEQAQGSAGGSAPANSDSAHSPDTLEQSGGNIDKIREILFGTNMREYDARFARLEEMLTREAAELRESSRRRFESLETYVRKEIESLQLRLRTERDERADAYTQQSRELKEISEAISRKIRDLDDHGAAVTSELRQEILNHSRNLVDELRSRHEDISNMLEKRFQVLQQNKTDRAALASLLTEVAMRINNEFHIPGADK